MSLDIRETFTGLVLRAMRPFAGSWRAAIDAELSGRHLATQNAILATKVAEAFTRPGIEAEDRLRALRDIPEQSIEDAAQALDRIIPPTSPDHWRDSYRRHVRKDAERAVRGALYMGRLVARPSEDQHKAILANELENGWRPYTPVTSSEWEETMGPLVELVRDVVLRQALEANTLGALSRNVEVPADVTRVGKKLGLAMYGNSSFIADDEFRNGKKVLSSVVRMVAAELAAQGIDGTLWGRFDASSWYAGSLEGHISWRVPKDTGSCVATKLRAKQGGLV